MANVLYVPRSTIVGENALLESMDILKTYGKKALIVTDGVMVKIGNVEKLTKALDSVNVSYIVYDEINGEPTHSMVDRGVEIYQEKGCDFLIALGGGSPMDAMKAIGVVVSNGLTICDYLGKKIEKPLPPMCAIPTTAGTGSEATKVSIITNTNTGVKMPLNDPRLLVDLAILDSEFTLTLPPEVTAATGVDALCHAVEAYTSLKAFPLADLFSVSAIKRIFSSLLDVYKDGSNAAARREMATAAFEAGVAFSSSSVTIVHGMSRPIGALFHVPHGMSNAMLLQTCLEFLKPGAVPQLCQLSKEIGVYKDGMSPEQGADAFVQAVMALLDQLNIKNMTDYNVTKEAFFEKIPKMSVDAIASKSPGNTRRTPSTEEVEELYRKFWENTVK